MIGRQVFLGAWLGLIVLGVGGRIVMRAIALATGAPASFSLGGTLTVVGMGIAAGIAGALLYAVSGVIAKRFSRRESLIRFVLFVVLLALVTARGLRGTPPAPSMAFWPLVALYAAAFLKLAPRHGSMGAGHDAGPGARSGRRWPLRFNRAPGNVR